MLDKGHFCVPDLPPGQLLTYSKLYCPIAGAAAPEAVGVSRENVATRHSKGGRVSFMVTLSVSAHVALCEKRGIGGV